MSSREVGEPPARPYAQDPRGLADEAATGRARWGGGGITAEAQWAQRGRHICRREKAGEPPSRPYAQDPRGLADEAATGRARWGGRGNHRRGTVGTERATQLSSREVGEPPSRPYAQDPRGLADEAATGRARWGRGIHHRGTEGTERATQLSSREVGESPARPYAQDPRGLADEAATGRARWGGGGGFTTEALEGTERATQLSSREVGEPPARPYAQDPRGLADEAAAGGARWGGAGDSPQRHRGHREGDTIVVERSGRATASPVRTGPSGVSG